MSTLDYKFRVKIEKIFYDHTDHTDRIVTVDDVAVSLMELSSIIRELDWVCGESTGTSDIRYRVSLWDKLLNGFSSGCILSTRSQAYSYMSAMMAGWSLAEEAASQFLKEVIA